ncbi:MAG: hypothetical protein HOO86_15580 [Bacteroidales bacterium]|nr:hypothetical protein [Bacteroidales bacterium]
MQAGKRVVFNTGILYINLLVRIFIGLFTTRLVLNALGKSDFGIYSLVGGVIGMLSFLATSMSISSMRFMSHSIGTGDIELIKKTFNTSLIIHFILGILVILILEGGGLLMFDYWLNIPPNSLNDAKIIFHFMVFSAFVTVISVPFDAVMNAHENFFASTLINTSGVVINLGIAIYITYLDSNLLVIYGFLILLNQIVIRIFKQWYSKYNYEECKVKLKEYVDFSLIKNMLSFVGWNILGVSGAVILVQSKDILLNMFFGVNLNASNGIASVLTERLNNFSASMTQAIEPQIMKNEGSGDRKKMINLVATGAKFSVFLISIFSIPVFIETPYLLELWLGNVPEYSVIFIRLIILSMILEKFTFPIITAIYAIGNVKEFTIVGFIIILLMIPISYWLYYLGEPPYTIFIVVIFIYICLAACRLYYGKKIAGINIKEYLQMVVLKSIIPLLISLFVAIIPFLIFEQSFIRLIGTTLLYIISSIIFIRYLGLTKLEYTKLKEIVKSSVNKFRSMIFERFSKLFFSRKD